MNAVSWIVFQVLFAQLIEFFAAAMQISSWDLRLIDHRFFRCLKARKID